MATTTTAPPLPPMLPSPALPPGSAATSSTSAADAATTPAASAAPDHGHHDHRRRKSSRSSSPSSASAATHSPASSSPDSSPSTFSLPAASSDPQRPMDRMTQLQRPLHQHSHHTRDVLSTPPLPPSSRPLAPPLRRSVDEGGDSSPSSKSPPESPSTHEPTGSGVLWTPSSIIQANNQKKFGQPTSSPIVHPSQWTMESSGEPHDVTFLPSRWTITRPPESPRWTHFESLDQSPALKPVSYSTVNRRPSLSSRTGKNEPSPVALYPARWNSGAPSPRQGPSSRDEDTTTPGTPHGFGWPRFSTSSMYGAPYGESSPKSRQPSVRSPSLRAVPVEGHDHDLVFMIKRSPTLPSELPDHDDIDEGDHVHEVPPFSIDEPPLTPKPRPHSLRSLSLLKTPAPFPRVSPPLQPSASPLLPPASPTAAPALPPPAEPKASEKPPAPAQPAAAPTFAPAPSLWTKLANSLRAAAPKKVKGSVVEPAHGPAAAAAGDGTLGRRISSVFKMDAKRAAAAPLPPLTPKSGAAAVVAAASASGDLPSRDKRQQYKYLKVLGVGVQGTVSLRLHTPTHAIVALKVISTMSSIDPDVRKSFRREVGILKLTAVHPNIVRLLDCWEGKHKVYQVFEVASGGDLEAACGGGALLPEDEAVRILTPVFDAVRFLHDLGILHRDVRPANVLLRRPLAGTESLQELQTIPVLSDFGIATFEAYSGRLATQYIEPPAHIAPEVVRGGRFTKASDNFGLGVIAVMVLLGRNVQLSDAYDDGGECEAAAAAAAAAAHPGPQDAAWRRLTSVAREQVRALLHVDPARRATAAAMMRGPWLEKWGVRYAGPEVEAVSAVSPAATPLLPAAPPAPKPSSA